MKRIPLTQGKFALVDDEDYERLVAMGKWYVHINDGRFYARTNIKKRNKRFGVLMHRSITCSTNTILVDHKNGNGLDNQKHNLRLCNNEQNLRNQKIRKDNTSGFKGVSWDKEKSSWKSSIMVNYKRIYLGRFTSHIEAARAYNKAALIHHGEFARLNEIPT